MPAQDPYVRHQADDCVIAIAGMAVIIAFASVEVSLNATDWVHYAELGGLAVRTTGQRHSEGPGS